MWLPWVLRLCLGKKPDKPPPDATAKPQDEDESVGPSTPMAQPPHIVEPDQDEPVPTPTLHKRDDVVVPLKEVILQRTCKSSLSDCNRPHAHVLLAESVRSSAAMCESSAIHIYVQFISGATVGFRSLHSKRSKLRIARQLSHLPLAKAIIMHALHQMFLRYMKVCAHSTVHYKPDGASIPAFLPWVCNRICSTRIGHAAGKTHRPGQLSLEHIDLLDFRSPSTGIQRTPPPLTSPGESSVRSDPFQHLHDINHVT